MTRMRLSFLLEAEALRGQGAHSFFFPGRLDDQALQARAQGRLLRRKVALTSVDGSFQGEKQGDRYWLSRTLRRILGSFEFPEEE